MIDWLRRVLGGQPHDSSLDQLLCDARGPRTSPFPLQDLRPVLIPSPILELDNWPGPKHYFGSLPVSLTWAFLRPENTMSYLSNDDVAAFESMNTDWRRPAREALHTDFGKRLLTHKFQGEGVEAVALLHDDGLGPSRLLCVEELRARLGDRFEWYVPERACAFVIAKRATPAMRKRITSAVAHCYESADVPMSRQAYPCEALEAVVAALDTP